MTARRAISATSTATAAGRRKKTEPVPSRAHLKYLAHRADEAGRMYRVSISQRLGATVINRRLRTWQIAVGKLELALKLAKVAA